MLLEEPQQLEAYILKTKDKYVIFFFFGCDGESHFYFQLKQIYLTNKICESVLLAGRAGVILASERSEFSWWKLQLPSLTFTAAEGWGEIEICIKVGTVKMKEREGVRIE